MNKGVIVLALAVLIALPLLATGASEGDDVPVLGVSLPGSVEFFSVERVGMDRAAQEFGVDLVYADAEWDPGKQLTQVEDFVARQVDMVLLCAADNQALFPTVDRCREADIPLMSFTNVLGNDPRGQLDGVVAFVGMNDIDQGRLLGDMAEQFVGDGPAKIVLIEGAPGTSPQRMRTEGFEQAVAAKPNWEIVYRQAIPGWTKEGSLAAVETFLQTNQEFDVVATHWHAAAAAAATAIREAGIEENGTDVVIVGLEYTKEIRPLIQNGEVNAISYASIQEMGYRTVELAAKYLQGESIPEYVSIDPIIVDASNVNDIEPEM